MSGRVDGRRPSIRTLFTASVVVFGIVALLVIVGLIGTSTLLQRTTTGIISNTRSMAIASELELHLLSYQRLSNLLVLTGNEELDGARLETAQEMRRLLAEARTYVTSVEEKERLDRVSQDLSKYLRAHEELAQESREVGEQIQFTRPLLANAVRSIEGLRAFEEKEVENAHDGALRVDGLSNAVGVSAAVLILVGFVGASVAVRRFVLIPLLDLHDATRRFRNGDPNARSLEQGARETSELAAALNIMLDTLIQQRQNQLAFLAGVAHDLRNPLLALKLAAHAAEQPQSPERHAQAVDMVNRQIQRLGRMVDDLLDATRIEAGSLDLELEDLDLRDVASEVAGIFGPTSPDHEVTTDLPPDPVVARADPLRLGQVVSNLVSNAIKYSPQGGPVTIAVRAAGQEGEIAVTDRGIGIALEKLDDIFLPFRRTSLAVAPGAGLGLSIVRRIVRAHGGHIEVQSELNVGSTFRVRLPLAREREA